MAAAGFVPGSQATIDATFYDSAKVLGDDGQVRNMMFKYVQDKGTISPTNSNNWKIPTPPVITISSVEEDKIYNVDVTPVITTDDSTAIVTMTLNGKVYIGGEITADGDYELIVTAVDLAGNTSTSTTNFIIDKTAPIITVTGVGNGEEYNKNVTPVFKANEGTATATLNGKEYIGEEVTADGEYELIVTAVDLAGNTSTSTINFIIDKISPIITITGAVNGEEYNKNVTPVFKANEGTATATLNGKDYKGEEITADGEYELIVTAVDLAGNTSTSTINFIIDKTVPDTTPPVITISSIENGKVYNGDVTPVIATDDSSSIVTMTLNGKEYKGEEITANGEYVLIVTAKDLAGNTSTSTINFTIDKTAPIIAVTGVTLNSSSESLKVGKTYQLVATLQPGDASNNKLIWTSSDSKIATVDANGKVTAVKVGTSTITVTTEDGHKVATCKVTVEAASVITIPQTGSPIDLTVLLVLGCILLGTGTLFVLKRKEEIK